MVFSAYQTFVDTKLLIGSVMALEKAVGMVYQRLHSKAGIIIWMARFGNIGIVSKVKNLSRSWNLFLKNIRENQGKYLDGLLFQ